MSSIKRSLNTLQYYTGTQNGVLITEVSAIQRFVIERSHCIYYMYCSVYYVHTIVYIRKVLGTYAKNMDLYRYYGVKILQWVAYTVLRPRMNIRIHVDKLHPSVPSLPIPSLVTWYRGARYTHVPFRSSLALWSSAV